MTTSRANLLAGVDMEGGEGFCDSIYNFLKNQGKDINLITNSGFGVWSQSDANKGLGTLVYDNLAVAVFQVGEAITTAAPPGGSGATGKVITDIAGTLTLGACTGRFNDNEQITGADSGTTADVNMPDAAAGVDLVRNGEFETGVGGWTPIDCALASVAGGQVGNCLRLTRTGAGAQSVSQDKTTEQGKIYKLSIYVKSGTSGNEAFSLYAYDLDGASFMGQVQGISGGAWVLYSITFESTNSGANRTRIVFEKNTATAGTMFFDEVTLYEITPCCTANDALAFDGWQKDVDIDIYRQHNDGGTLTKDGSFYALQMVPATANHMIIFPVDFDNEEWYQQFAGRTITFGAWIKTSTASHIRFRISDGTGDVYSSYHTGGGAWEWLEMTRTVAATPTRMYVGFRPEQAPNVDGTTIVYVSQPMLVFGSSLGEGMYQPRLQEIIWTDKLIESNKFYALLNQSDSSGGINSEADSDAKIPKGAKAVYVHIRLNDLGSAGVTTNARFLCYQSATKAAGFSTYAAGLENDAWASLVGWLDLDPDGNFLYILDASAANNLDLQAFWYQGIQVN